MYSSRRYDPRTATIGQKIDHQKRLTGDLQTCKVPTMANKTNAQKLKELSDLMDCRGECPECSSHGPHDFNGDNVDPSFLCNSCGYSFDLEPAKRAILDA